MKKFARAIVIVIATAIGGRTVKVGDVLLVPEDVGEDTARGLFKMSRPRAAEASDEQVVKRLNEYAKEKEQREAEEKVKREAEQGDGETDTEIVSKAREVANGLLDDAEEVVKEAEKLKQEFEVAAGEIIEAAKSQASETIANAEAKAAEIIAAAEKPSKKGKTS